MKILLLGSEGMLGGEFLSLLKVNHNVVGKDIHDFDITSAEDCLRLIEENRPDVVINAVAYTDVDGCEANKEKCFAVNAEGVKNVAIACRDRKIKIVHFSTDYVFDGKKIDPYCEDDVCCPLNVYGESKLAGEEFLINISRNFLLIRTAWMYSERGKNFVKTILEKAKTVEQLDVVDDQIGCPTYALDLSVSVKRLLEDGHNGIFNITNGGSCSWYEFARAILTFADLTGAKIRPIKSDKLTRPAKRPCNSVLDGSRLLRVTGIAMRPWRMALRDCVGKITVPIANDY